MNPDTLPSCYRYYQFDIPPSERQERLSHTEYKPVERCATCEFAQGCYRTYVHGFGGEWNEHV